MMQNYMRKQELTVFSMGNYRAIDRVFFQSIVLFLLTLKVKGRCFALWNWCVLLEQVIKYVTKNKQSKTHCYPKYHIESWASYKCFSVPTI